MNFEEKRLIQKHQEALIKDMSPEDLMEDLVENSVIDNVILKRLEEFPVTDPQGKAKLLLQAVMNSKHPVAMEIFLETLKRTHQHLYDLLCKNENAKSKINKYSAYHRSASPKPGPDHDRESVIAVPKSRQSTPPSDKLPDESTKNTEKFSEMQLWKIAKILDKNGCNWKTIAKNLGLITSNRIGEIENKFQNDYKGMCHEMLLLWLQSKPEKCNKETLFKALEEAEMRSAIQDLKKLFAKKEFYE